LISACAGTSPAHMRCYPRSRPMERIHEAESLVRKNLFTMTNSREPREARHPRRKRRSTPLRQ